jgi:uncharacterized protein with PQ loop repeat
MPISVVVLVAAVANTLGSMMTLPQVVRLARTKQVAGVSATWAALSMVVNAWWLVYGLAVRDPGIVPVSLLAALAYLVILITLHRLEGATISTSLLGPVAGVVALPALGLVLGGWDAAGVVLGALYGVQLAPAVITAFRSRDVAGIAPGTWLLAWVEASLWGIYGVARDDAGLVVLSVMGVLMSSAVLARLAWRAPVSRILSG